MTMVGIQLTRLELRVVLLHVAGLGLFQQVIARVHLQTETLERLYHLRDIRDDGFVRFLRSFHLSQEVVDERRIYAELHLLGVHHDQFQFRRMLLVEQ